MFELINTILIDFFQKLIVFLPNFISGIIILLIGLVIAAILKKLVHSLFSFVRLDMLLEKTKLISKNEVMIWEEVLEEILRWTIVIVFLIPTLEVWNLSQATAVINQFLFYLPNVIVAVIIGFVGLIAANLAYDLVKHGFKTLGNGTANTLAILSKSLIIFFVVLVILNQLGVAQDLVRILFTGIVAMLALAGGLAFGLGGRDIAKQILEELRNKFKQ